MMDSNFSEQHLAYFEHHNNALLDDLSGLIAIPSTRDLSTKTDNAPFGIAIREAFDYLIKFAHREGLSVRDHQGYALDISIGSGEEEIAILHHVDVVEAGNYQKWKTPPFKMHQQGDLLFGRGVTDNKGPLMASLYILKWFKECQIPLNKTIKVIIGGAEETTWECVDHYFNHNPQPDYGFSPDGDFPIVNGEKGILYASLEHQFDVNSEQGSCQIVNIKSERDRTSTCHHLMIEFAGEQAASVAKQFESVAKITQTEERYCVELSTPWEKSRNPQKVNNCINIFVHKLQHVDALDTNSKKLIQLLDTWFVDSTDGSKLGLAHQDEEMGMTTCCVSSLNMDQHGYNLDFDFRFPKGLTIDKTRTQLHTLSQQYGVSFVEHQYLPLSYLSPENRLIQVMGKAYFDVTQTNAQCFSKGAASYARALENGVAFGPTFPGDKTFVHEPNEQLSLRSLHKSIIIYVKVLISL